MSHRPIWGIHDNHQASHQFLSNPLLFSFLFSVWLWLLALALIWSYMIYLWIWMSIFSLPDFWLLILLNNFLIYTQPCDTSNSRLSLVGWLSFVLALWDPLPVPELVDSQSSLTQIHMRKDLDNVNHGSDFCVIAIFFW